MSHVSLNDDCIAPRASRFPKRRRQKASARPLKGLHSRSSFCRARGVKRTWRGCFLKEKSRYVHGESHSADYPPFFPSASSIQPLSPLVGYVGTENYLPRLDRNKMAHSSGSLDMQQNASSGAQRISGGRQLFNERLC